jgi:hypothetical protein
VDTPSPENKNTIEELASKYGVSNDAVRTLSQAVIAGNGTMAQFNHPELGGPGQWLKSGMTMVGDMFNDRLKATVQGLCSELANRPAGASWDHAPDNSLHAQNQTRKDDHDNVSLYIPAQGSSRGDWWGADLGKAAATGSQNNTRYAFFPAAHRLAIKVADHVTIYDTEDHQISGVSQQQSRDTSLTFTSQRGLVRLDDLRVVG